MLESEAIFTWDPILRDVCLKLKEAAQTPEMRTVIRYVMKMSAQNR